MPDLAAAASLSNRFAPEHLELAVASPEDLLPAISSAGAVFLGAYSSESLGDYCAGTNHVLPTSGAARFSSPLSVYDFQTRTSIVNITERVQMRSLKSPARSLTVSHCRLMREQLEPERLDSVAGWTCRDNGLDIKLRVGSFKSYQYAISGSEAGNGLHCLPSIGNPLCI